MRLLLEEFDGEVPRRLDELDPAAGRRPQDGERRRSELGDTQGIVVDTHVRRLSQRLGLHGRRIR
jgi:endonuclease-3